MPDADLLFDLPTVRREFRGLRFANNFGDARGSARAWFACLDLEPAKRGGLLDLPFPHAERAGKLTQGQSSGVPRQNALDAVETFAAEGKREHGERRESSVWITRGDKTRAKLKARVLCSEGMTAKEAASVDWRML